MRSSILLVCSIAALIFLSGCATVFRSDVSTFHPIGLPPARSFAILPIPDNKRDSLEYAQYAASIIYELQHYGYQPVEEGKKAELVIGFDVVQSEGRERLYSRPSSSYFDAWNRGFFYGGWRPFYYSNWGYGYGWPDYGHQRELAAQTIYPTSLILEIRNGHDGQLIFEGRATADPRHRDLPSTIPLLARALFADFPGPDGVTREVRLTLDREGRSVKEDFGRAVEAKPFSKEDNKPK